MGNSDNEFIQIIMNTYLLQCSKTKIFKIGHSKNPLRRIREIRVGNPTVELVGLSSQKEPLLHEKFSAYRIGGEWFNLPEEIWPKLFQNFERIEILDYSNIAKSPIITKLDKMYIEILRNPDKPLPESYKHPFSDLYTSKKKYRDLYNKGGAFTRGMNYAIYELIEESKSTL